MTRALIHVPIVHSHEDMGQLGQRLAASPAARAWWARTSQQVRSLGLVWPRVKVYQDGLPDADAAVVARIVGEVSSPNFELLRWLAGQGAEVVGTESPELLREEYAGLRAILTAPDAAARERARRSYAQRARALLAERDAYIARRIDATLSPGWTGLLFVGQAHRVAPHLPPTITVRPLGEDRPGAGR